MTASAPYLEGSNPSRESAQVAALFVRTGGVYFDRPDVDPWDEKRDAMKYEGPLPVVAHPPCNRWCQIAGLNQHRWGFEVGKDGGLFEFALSAVRRWGGILEHPAYTRAWAAYDLTPPRRGGWQRTIDGGWVAHIEQGMYGHKSRKQTWLYAYGVGFLPSLEWGKAEGKMYVSRLKLDDYGHVPRLTKKEALETPPEFCELLIRIAQSAHP